jgi:transposase-like protein
MVGEVQQPIVDEQAVQLIAARVIASLREELDTLIAGTAAKPTANGMTVAQVARLLGVARSTVYTHWREWGGYKLGPGPKAPIRFDGSRLPTAPRRTHGPSDESAAPAAGRRRRQRRALIIDAPRLPKPSEQAA